MKAKVLESELAIILSVKEGMNTTYSQRYAHAIINAIPKQVLSKDGDVKKELYSLARSVELLAEQQK